MSQQLLTDHINAADDLITSPCFPCKGWGQFSDESDCETCGGSGKVSGPRCLACDGTGKGWTPITCYKGYPRCSFCNGTGIRHEVRDLR